MNRTGRIVGAGLVVVAAVVAAPFVPWAAWTDALHGAGVAGMVAFSVLYALATTLLIPGSPLTLAAGAAWGPVAGFAVVWPGAVLGAMASFALGRTTLRGRARTALEASPRGRAVDAAIADQGGWLVLWLRLSPVFPFNVLNLALGATPIRPGPYTLATAVGIVPGTALYVAAGAAIGDLGAVAAGVRPASATPWWATALAVGGTLAVTVLVTRIARQALATHLEDSP